jgi:predicted RNA-binding Zn-ribbon protein involved in translation (DUF1610 family)
MAETQEEPIICDSCGGQMVSRLCKLICPNCGRKHDCSDGEY